MSCNLSFCFFYLFLSVLFAFGIYLVIYIIIYIYIARITTKYHSNDLVTWRENELNKIEQKYVS